MVTALRWILASAIDENESKKINKASFIVVLEQMPLRLATFPHNKQQQTVPETNCLRAGWQLEIEIDSSTIHLMS
jgi:hypothetical protein